MALANKWDYNKPPILPLFDKIGNMAGDLYTKHFPDARAGIVRMLSLYGFILNHLYTPPQILQQLIVDKGIPIFSVQTVAEIQNKVRSQQNTAFARRIYKAAGPMRGGERSPTAANTNSAAVNAAVASAAAPTEDDKDPSRSKFWDVFIKKRLFDLTKGIPPAFDGFAPIIFGLYGLEQMEVIGPLIASFLDSLTLGLPVIGELMATTVGTFISLAPLPYAGFVGDLAAYFIGLIFVMISSVMSVSRRQFGTSFIVSLDAIPFIGEQVSDAALLFEKGYERYDFNKTKLLTSLDKVSPHMAAFLAYWAPSKEEKKGPPVVFDPDLVLLDLFKKVVDSQGEDVAMAMVINPTAMPDAARDYVSDKYKSKLGSNKKGGRRRTRRVRK